VSFGSPAVQVAVSASRGFNTQRSKRAPTTAPPAGITPAAPGQILVAGTTLDIVSGCTSNPVPGYDVSSFVAYGDFGPLVVEEGRGEASAFDMFSDSGNAIDTDEYEDLGDAGFGMFASQGDSSFEVAANPGNCVRTMW
jgi:hypothetical protein